MSKKSREFDIVVWGATGFTGELVAEYLARHSSLSWAIAGRSESKLQGVRERLAKIDAAAGEVEIIVADSLDRTSLDAMCARTKVVASTVGPFAKFGADVVAACVANGTHYCDITGEPQFVRNMIDLHHEDAEAAGVRILHCCGFDSIPSDLGSHCIQQLIIEATGGPAQKVESEIRRLKGVGSGGTIASIVNILDEAREDPNIRKIAGSPYSLNPPDKRKGPRVDMQVGVRKRENGWSAPFLMAAINEKIVRRSHALLYPELDHITYSEVSVFGHGLKGFQRALGGVGLLAGVGVGLGVKPLRGVVSKFLPDPGEGPTREQIAAGGFTYVVFANASGQRFECKVVGASDPGYGETSKMLSETATCLALDEPREDALAGGVLTPASGCGMALVERLRDAGMTFDVTVS